MSLQVSRPVDPSLHPLVTANYLRTRRELSSLPRNGRAHLRRSEDRQDAFDRILATAACQGISQSDELSCPVRAQAAAC
jgi:hypothetical protein